MTQYKYATVLEAQNDGRKPNDNFEKGDKTVKAGKHESDSIEYMTEDNEIHVIEFEPVATYESEHRMGEREAQEFARDQWFNDQE